MLLPYYVQMSKYEQWDILTKVGQLLNESFFKLKENLT